MIYKLLKPLNFKNPIVIKLKNNNVLIWKNRRAYATVIGGNPAAVDQWRRLLTK